MVLAQTKNYVDDFWFKRLKRWQQEGTLGQKRLTTDLWLNPEQARELGFNQGESDFLLKSGITEGQYAKLPESVFYQPSLGVKSVPQSPVSPGLQGKYIPQSAFKDPGLINDPGLNYAIVNADGTVDYVSDIYGNLPEGAKLYKLSETYYNSDVTNYGGGKPELIQPITTTPTVTAGANELLATLQRLYPDRLAPLAVTDEDLLFKEYQRTGGQLDLPGWQLAGSPLRPEMAFDYLQDLTERATIPEAETILRGLGLSEQDLNQILGAQKREDELLVTLNTIPALRGYTLESLATLIETDLSGFVTKIQAGGITPDKKALLETMGFTSEDIAQIFPPTKPTITQPATGLTWEKIKNNIGSFIKSLPTLFGELDLTGKLAVERFVKTPDKRNFLTMIEAVGGLAMGATGNLEAGFMGKIPKKGKPPAAKEPLPEVKPPEVTPTKPAEVAPTPTPSAALRTSKGAVVAPEKVTPASEVTKISAETQRVMKGRETILENVRRALVETDVPGEAITILPDGVALTGREFRGVGAFQHLAEDLPPVGEWVDAGAIRIVWEEGENLSIELGETITAKQFSRLSKEIAAAKNVFIDITDYKGDIIKTIEGTPNIIRGQLRDLIPKAEAVPKAVKPTEVLTGIKEPLPKVEGKAANIRLDKFNEDVRPVIKDWADAHPVEVQDARRGVISDAQVRLKAEQLVNEVGGDLDKLRAEWKPGTAWTAEETTAIRGALAEKTKIVLDAQKLVAKDASPENLLKLELAIREQAAVQEVVHGVTAEAGRALRSFRQSFNEALGDEGKMAELLKRIGGKANSEKVAKLLGQLDINDSVAVNRFIQSLSKPKIGDYLTEIFYNSILSGPKTHIVNALSNTVNAIWSPVERTASALLDIPLSVIQGRARQRFLSEVPADIFGAIKGIPEGFRQFAYVIKNGISLEDISKWEFRQKAFKGKVGAVINLPSRFLEGADQLMKAVNGRAALNAEAHRLASTEKLTGQAFEKRVAELLSEPPADLLAKANTVAEYRLFRAPMGKTGQAILKARESVEILGFQPGRFLVPFVRTPINLVKYGIERTPLGFANPKLLQNLASKNPEAADQLARAVIGSIGLASLIWYAKEGKITGAPPRSAAERERFYREGKQPYAIRVGEFWVSYQRLEPLNQLLSQTSIIVEGINSKDRDITEKIGDAVNTFGQNFVSQTYMSSLSDFLNMMAEPERYAGNWFNRFATAMVVPMSSASRTATQMLDDVVRDPQNAWEMIQTNIPGLSKNIQPKITALGEQIKRKSPPWFPINVTPVEETILSQELERLEYNIGMVSGTIAGVELTDEEKSAYQELAGGITKTDLERLMLAPDYWTADDEQKKKMVAKVIDTARETAKLKMRQKMFSAGSPEERIIKLQEGLRNADSQLGKVLSSTPEFSHEPPNIYDIPNELDAAYHSLLDGIPQESLKNIKPPPTVASWYEKETAKATIKDMPNKRLSLLNADPKQGDTFEDYYNQWQQYQASEDKEKWVKEHPNYDKYYLGNISRRDFEDLKTYHSLAGQEQLAFLKNHPNLNANSKEDWLMDNPKANAQAVLWGEGSLLTKEAYDEFKKLVKELDVPDSLLSKDATPENLPVFEIVAEKKFRDITKQIESLASISDEKLRKEEIAKLKDTKISGDMSYRDLERKVRVLKMGDGKNPVDPKIVDAYVKHERLADEPGRGPGSSESMLSRFDNPDMDKFFVDNDIWQPLDKTREPSWRIDVKYRKEDAEYEAIKNPLPSEQARLRDEYLAKNEAYRKDRRRREAYGLTNSQTGEKFPVSEVENYVAYHELPAKGFRQERMFYDDSGNITFFGQMMRRIVGRDIKPFDKIPNVAYDDIYDQYPGQFDELEGLSDNKSQYYIEDTKARDKARDALRFNSDGSFTEFGLAELRRNAYGMFVPNAQIENYVGYYTRPKGPYEDDWFLQEHPDFYQQIYLGILGNQRKDYRKVPNRRVYAKYLIYDKMFGKVEKQNYRFNNPDLEDWLFLTGKVKTRIKEERANAELTPYEKLQKRLGELPTLILK